MKQVQVRITNTQTGFSRKITVARRVNSEARRYETDDELIARMKKFNMFRSNEHATVVK